MPDGLASISLPNFAAIVGAEHVLTAEADRAFYSQDVFAAGETAQAVLQPGSVDELSRVVRAATERGLAVFPRGGGMSYTAGYTPSVPDGVVIDLRRLDRVVEINRADMYVTVEAGITWAALHEALNGTGLRTPFWGSLSGLKATVGGGMSQNATFFGASQHGSAVDSVIGLKVVLADGRVVTTGSAAVQGGNGFFRHYGPDLTGLFTSDCGALGFKAEVTLQLMPAPAETRYASFAFRDHRALFDAMAGIARAGLASECFGFDPELQQVQMERQGLFSNAKALTGVMKASGSFLGAVKEGAKLAASGGRFAKDGAFVVHLACDHDSAAGADHAVARAQEIGRAAGGELLDPSIPKVVRSIPFQPLNSVLGPKGERWAPVHCIVPHSRAAEVYEAVEALFAEQAEAIARHAIRTGYLLATVGRSASLIEPVFYWPDAATALHHDTVEASVLKKVTPFDANPEARAVVSDLRQRLADLFRAMATVHFQIGKTYRYAEGLQPETLALVQALKQTVDPKGLVNPGALGLAGPRAHQVSLETHPSSRT